LVVTRQRTSAFEQKLDFVTRQVFDQPFERAR
jgi:hypothetical protein